jgi:two-component system phosphate regulon sensor histidine kinase PhoR
MRIRLQLLLPLVFGLLVAGGFIVAGTLVGGGVREALVTIPGLTRERAVEAAVRAVGIGGVVATVLAVLVGVLVARMIVRPLTRMQRAAVRLVEDEAAPDDGGPVAEIQDVARGISVAAGELRDRQGRELRERSELAALVEAVSEGIIQVDGQARIARVNRSARELLGLPVDAAGRPVASLFRSPALRDIMEAGAAGRGTEAAEVVLDDRRVLVSAAAQPEGGAVATFVDLTDLRRLEEVRRDFVANASHELKTPLTSIRGYTETLLAGDLPDSERRQFLATISRNAERLQRIVDDLLDLSRLEAGRWQPEIEPVRVIKAAEACWLGFADRAADQGVGFRVAHDGPDTALADRRALEQVFANLFDNALRYARAQDRISVRTRVASQPPVDRNGSRRAGGGVVHEGPWLVTEVADSGTGIPRDALPRIFERFYRVDPARSRAEGGTGLGLSIVKHMLESMGGGVEADSELGKGTTVRLWLPAPA